VQAVSAIGIPHGIFFCEQQRTEVGWRSAERGRENDEGIFTGDSIR
jgi:hypothetical protein